MTTAWLALIVEVIAMPFTSPWFVPRRLYVENANPYESAAVGAMAASACTRPLLAVNRSALSRRLLKDPRLAEARVSLAMPAAIRVTLVHRKPFVVVTDGITAILATSELLAYDQVAMNDIPKGVPLVRIPPPLRAKIGALIADDNAVVGCEALREVRKRMSSHDLYITVDPQANICLNMGAAAPIRLGGRDRLSTKVALLSEVIRRFPTVSDDAEYIDISNPDAPVRKRRTGKTSDTGR